jgi:hypothetical protein
MPKTRYRHLGEFHYGLGADVSTNGGSTARMQGLPVVVGVLTPPRR